ncbi:unnamed protein product [Acanthosepion pharaonis]|uniref:Uncharacterized protein n=1 Tax=Acanthosepion pharaonis TaxID=158019 RepID=A0A812ALR3_ACAPH|nr:unnamed protein product [Sepia pharaonis]
MKIFFFQHLKKDKNKKKPVCQSPSLLHFFLNLFISFLFLSISLPSSHFFLFILTSAFSISFFLHLPFFIFPLSLILLCPHLSYLFLNHISSSLSYIFFSSLLCPGPQSLFPLLTISFPITQPTLSLLPFHVSLHFFVLSNYCLLSYYTLIDVFPLDYNPT